MHGPSQGDCGLYTALLPSFILFIVLNKYLYRDRDVLSHLMLQFQKGMGCSPASLPTCLKVNGPAKRVYTEGVCEQSLWLHHTPPNHFERISSIHLKENTILFL